MIRVFEMESAAIQSSKEKGIALHYDGHTLRLWKKGAFDRSYFNEPFHVVFADVQAMRNHDIIQRQLDKAAKPVSICSGVTA